MDACVLMQKSTSPRRGMIMIVAVLHFLTLLHLHTNEQGFSAKYSWKGNTFFVSYRWKYFTLAPTELVRQMVCSISDKKENVICEYWACFPSCWYQYAVCLLCVSMYAFNKYTGLEVPPTVVAQLSPARRNYLIFLFCSDNWMLYMVFFFHEGMS